MSHPSTRHATEAATPGATPAPSTTPAPLSLEFIREHPRVRLYIRMADASL